MSGSASVICTVESDIPLPVLSKIIKPDVSTNLQSYRLVLQNFVRLFSTCSAAHLLYVRIISSLLDLYLTLLSSKHMEKDVLRRSVTYCVRISAERTETTSSSNTSWIPRNLQHEIPQVH